ncbi:MAG: radical SAM protein [Candidatus Aminicenantes bacterium]|nr:radical SAM protein [Candidatus Aminicenantes bacterium]NIM83973.1 radical SAM protein [Candidatus Aminicenantes bacterium]NIN23447.1 radical SAM protein [Candidatus Aminicenantes bacterium]NIN47152.1 radical SAM protein [Candidatus Aminicenantes bacterium]NIN90076.1 radical SAM protein [Candidatus Aminicenantes bacterium]
MRQHNIMTHLPEDYFKGKDGTTYRFTILKDIATAGADPPIPYNDSHQDSILSLYPKYKDFALYVHFPWCIEHCSYCYYYQSPMLKRSVLERMLAAERKHARLMDEWIDLPNRNVRSIYFGGGTPTVVPADLLDETIGYFVDRYRSNDDCEVCLECSVITLKPRKIAILQRYINRLSIGVQAFDDRILKLIERKHTGAQAREVLSEVIPRFASVNVDLIYGLNDQGLDVWLASVEKAIQLGVPSLTIYRLDIREMPAIIRTFRKEPERFPDEHMCWQMYNEARQMLKRAGYRENLVGWFLLPQVKDTTVYRERWEKQSPCIAFGPGLHNYAADHFYETLPDHDQYAGAVEAGKLPIQQIYTLTPEKQLIWYVLAQLKSNSPVYKSVIINRFGQDRFNWFMGLVRNYINWGVLQEFRDKLELSEDYHYILEWMLVELIDSLK